MTEQTPTTAVILTEEMIARCRSDRGGFTREAAQWLGERHPLRAGWSRRIIGRPIPLAHYQAAVASRNGRLGGQSWPLRSPGQYALGI